MRHEIKPPDPPSILMVSQLAKTLELASGKSFIRMARREGLPVIKISDRLCAVDSGDWSEFLKNRKEQL